MENNMKKFVTVFALFGLMMWLIACQPETVEDPLLIAEIEADGSFTVTKHPGTGGLISVGTITAQLL